MLAGVGTGAGGSALHAKSRAFYIIGGLAEGAAGGADLAGGRRDPLSEVRNPGVCTVLQSLWHCRATIPGPLFLKKNGPGNSPNGRLRPTGWECCLNLYIHHNPHLSTQLKTY